MRMEGKNILITGASRSIGRACAERFAEEGGNIAILDMLEEAGQKSADEIAEKFGVKAVFYKCNVMRQIEAYLIMLFPNFSNSHELPQIIIKLYTPSASLPPANPFRQIMIEKVQSFYRIL